MRMSVRAIVVATAATITMALTACGPQAGGGASNDTGGTSGPGGIIIVEVQGTATCSSGDTHVKKIMGVNDARNDSIVPTKLPGDGTFTFMMNAGAFPDKDHVQYKVTVQCGDKHSPKLTVTTTGLAPKIVCSASTCKQSGAPKPAKLISITATITCAHGVAPTEVLVGVNRPAVNDLTPPSRLSRGRTMTVAFDVKKLSRTSRNGYTFYIAGCGYNYRVSSGRTYYTAKVSLLCNRKATGPFCVVL